jgi:hypothetical protein
MQIGSVERPADPDSIKLEQKKRSPCFSACLLLSVLLNVLLASALVVFFAVPSTYTAIRGDVYPKGHAVSLTKKQRKHTWLNQTSAAQRRRLQKQGSGSLEGAAWSDYSAQVQIGSQIFEVIVDTGSSTFAVAASAADDCHEHYSGTCAGAAVSADYGSGSWSGNACQGPAVKLEGLEAGAVPFAGILQQQTFLNNCQESSDNIISEGILGMAYQDLIEEGQPFVPLFDSVVSKAGIANMFALQCCGWGGGDTPGTGTLTLGGVDTSAYTGSFSYTPITKEEYYCVSVVSVTTNPPIAAADALSASPSPDPSPDDEAYSYAADGDTLVDGRRLLEFDAAGGTCGSIIDSGTSELVLTREHADLVSYLKGLGKPCSASARAARPKIVLTMGGMPGQPDFTLTIPPERYYQPDPNGGECYELFVSAGGAQGQNIVGQVMMEEYYTVFDKANKRVGFAPIAGCDYSSD